MSEQPATDRVPNNTLWIVAEQLNNARYSVGGEALTQPLGMLRAALDAGKPGAALTYARQLQHQLATAERAIDAANRREVFERGWRAAQAPAEGEWTMKDWFADVAETMEKIR